MGFEIILMMVLSFLFPIIMLFFGILMKSGWPRKINDFAGFRTTRAKSSNEAWRFAHKLCGNIWTVLSIVLLIPNVVIIALFFYMNSIRPDAFVMGLNNDSVLNISIVSTVVSAMAMIVSVVFVQVRLCEKFDKDGAAREE